MKLAYKSLGSGKPFIILHGLFGSSDNWQTLGKRFSEDFKVYLVDQRNHGKSPHSDDFNYDLLADDLKEFVDSHNIAQPIVLGHSMGGKTAMRFAQKYPDQMSQLIVADMGVKTYAPHHDDVLTAFKTVNPDKIDSRREAEDLMKPVIENFGIRQFLLKNLHRKGKDSFEWRVNYPVIENKMEEILAALPNKKAECETLFIYGSKSDYISPEEFDSIRKIFPKAKFEELPTGHWIHAEDPDGFYAAVKNFVTL
ncbi:MAG TPA: alpha/beta fold hydrolase [Cryomorphaceae bacterium]|nr:alpha/beta fold hydrolase [Cryomorphaceae bacterium]